MNKLHVKKGDTVVLLSGKDKGKQGKVVATSPKEQKIIVEGVNIATKHVKPRKMGENGGIVKVETAFYASKAMLVCPKCSKPTRIAHKFVTDKTNPDKIVKMRACKACDAAF